MFSRLANVSSSKASILYRLVGTSANASAAVAPTAAAVAAKPADGFRRYPHDAPERDFVNYPPFRWNETSGLTRFAIVPIEWCNAMYDKTGVTGPFILFWGAAATLFSKEFLIYHVDSAEQLCFFFTVAGVANLFGPKIGIACDKLCDDARAEVTQSLANQTIDISNSIEKYSSLNSLPEANTIIHDAKRENVLLHLEASYRQRIAQAYQDVKKRLDYQVSVQNAFRRLERDQAINFIVGGAAQSIGAAQEKEAFQSGLSQLKALSQKYAAQI